MKNIGVFYDLDKTLIHGISGLGFVQLAFQKGLLATTSYLKLIYHSIAYRFNKFDYEKSVSKNLKLLIANRTASIYDDLGREGLDRYTIPRLYPEMLHRIEWHRNQGHIQFMVTSAFDSVCKPIFEYLNLDDLCCTIIERKNGLFTGNTNKPLCHDEGKAYYMKGLVEKHQIDLSRSFAYADNITDVPMLKMVGNPVATNPDKFLRREAIKENWAILKCKKPSKHSIKPDQPSLEKMEDRWGIPSEKEVG